MLEDAAGYSWSIHGYPGPRLWAEVDHGSPFEHVFCVKTAIRTILFNTAITTTSADFVREWPLAGNRQHISPKRRLYIMYLSGIVL